MRARFRAAGAFLAGMVVPNIGAFIAWGFLTALFIPSGWIPNPHLARIVTPMSINLLPILIGFTGGRLVHGIRGGVVGATATMGAVAGSDVPMFMGAMVLGPLGGWLMRKFDEAAAARVPAGFEMLVANFSAGILGLGLTLLGYVSVQPLAQAIVSSLSAGARTLTAAGLLPLLALLIEPGKVLFVNNAINHGVFAPLGVAEAQQTGKSIFFLLEPNPGPGLGLLAAYWLFGRGAAKHSSPAAMVIHFFGGIHEMYFPYVLMNPLTILAVTAGGLAGGAVYVTTHAGLVATPSPGSIFAHIALAPRGGLLPVLMGIAAGAVISFVAAAPIVSRSSSADGPPREAPAGSAASRLRPAAILFVCEAGMGSSVMGASILRRKLREIGLEIEVRHAALSEVPPSAEVLVVHRSLAARVREVAPRAHVYAVDEFLNPRVYEDLIRQLAPEEERNRAART